MDLLSVRNELKQHLSRRESFSRDMLSTIVCNYPVNMAGLSEDNLSLIFLTDRCTAITYFMNNTDTIRIYISQIPGIFTIRTSNRTILKKEGPESWLSEAVSLFNKNNKNAKEGYTAALYLPLSPENRLNREMAVLSLYLAQCMVSSDNRAGSHPVNYIKESLSALNNKYSRIYDKIQSHDMERTIVLTGSSMIDDTRQSGLNLVVMNIEANLSEKLAAEISGLDHDGTLKLAGMLCGSQGIRGFTEIEEELFKKISQRMSPSLRDRAEFLRQYESLVNKAHSAWNGGDAAYFGKLMVRCSYCLCDLVQERRLRDYIDQLSEMKGVYGTSIRALNGILQLVLLSESAYRNDIALHLRQVKLPFPHEVKNIRYFQPASLATQH